MKREFANEILAASRKGYNKISSDFSHTRKWFWPELRFIRNLIPDGAHLLDVGCGNGRFLEVLEGKPLSYTGIDFSEELIRIACGQNHEHPYAKFIVGDALVLPFPDKHFEIVVSFAVLHHIPSRTYRVQFLREAARVTKPEGLIILTAWNVWCTRPLVILFFACKKLLGLTRLDFGDAVIGFNTKKNVRFVHAFTMREIRSLAEEAGLSVKRLEKIRRPSGEENFFVILRT